MAVPEPRRMFVVPEWIEAHCVIPDGFRAGAPFRLYDFQLTYLANFYLVRGDARWVPEAPILAPAFVYRRGMIVGPQKLGKDPMEAAQICLEGGGPALFAGFAGPDEGYVCREHGCRCGWEYPYDVGEPRGMAWPTPLIQITAVSEDQTGNTYDALRPMIDRGPLHDLIPKTGEEWIRLPGGGKIETVTSSAPSRLGQPVTHAAQGEIGLWTKRNGMAKVADTQYRNLAGMGGRASANTNAWDPSENSVAQEQYESKATDIYRQFTQPPASLSFANKSERRRLFRIVYPEDTRREHGGHVDLDSIDAEAIDLAARDSPQAERFFGNRLVQGSGKAFDITRFVALAVSAPRRVPRGTLITIGIDGSRLWDHFSMIGTEVESGYQWPLGIWIPDGPEAEVPMDLVDATLSSAFEEWAVWRAYVDPPFIDTWVAAWAGRFGKDRVVPWWTNRPKFMAYALRGWSEAQRSGELSHCASSDPFCPLFAEHVANAIRKPTGYEDEAGGLWVVEKDRKGSANKIDSVPAATLSWQARTDALTAGAGLQTNEPSIYEARGLRTLAPEETDEPTEDGAELEPVPG